MAEPPLHVALMHPEIPGNTGNIGRLCVGVGAALHLVHPLGFDTSDKAVRRAGLDYWKHVDVTEHDSEAAFLAWARGRTVIAFSAKASPSASSSAVSMESASRVSIPSRTTIRSTTTAMSCL